MLDVLRHVVRADQEGTYDGRSAILSGQGYSTMSIEVSVVSPAQYEIYVKAQAKDIQEAQDTVEKQNKAAADSAAKIHKEAATNNTDTAKSAGDGQT